MKDAFSSTPVFYFGNPYTNPDPLVMACRAECVDKAAARLLTHDIVTYPPIAINSRWNAYENFPHVWSFWEKTDKSFLCRCDGLIVLKLDGWEESVGLISEIEYATELGMPICFITYDDLMNGKIQDIVNMRDSLSKKLKSLEEPPKKITEEQAKEYKKFERRFERDHKVFTVDVGDMTEEDAREVLSRFSQKA